MTHMPRAVDAIKPWLKKNVPDDRFWDGLHDPTHSGVFGLPTPTEEEREVFLERFAAMPNPLLKGGP